MKVIIILYVTLADIKTYYNNLSSQINDILEKPSFTLEELLKEDDLLQEAKSLNSKLLDLYVHHLFLFFIINQYKYFYNFYFILLKY